MTKVNSFSFFKYLLNDLSQSLLSQFQNPQGFLGHIAGWIMAYRPSNQSRNQWTLDLLNLQACDRVLEIGYGPGMAIAQAAKIVDKIIGIDVSRVMLKQAHKNNKVGISQGRVQLLQGSIEQFPSSLGTFDQIFSVNVVQFWQNPAIIFPILFNLLRTNGQLAITYQPRHQGASLQDIEQMSQRINRAMETAGFQKIQFHRLELKPFPAVCILGNK